MNSSAHLVDRATQELIDAGNYKQAIKNIDKKLKKGPKEPRLLTAKAFAQLRSGDIKGSNVIVTEILNLKPPISDKTTVCNLYSILCDLRRHGAILGDREAEDLWQNAVKEQPQQQLRLELSEEWASNCIFEKHWSLLIKAAINLQKLEHGHPTRSRMYWWWTIVARVLSANVQTSSSQLRAAADLNAKLAVKMLETAVQQSTKNERAKQQPGLWVTSSQEARFLISVLRNFYTSEKLLELLNDEALSRSLNDEYEREIMKSRLFEDLQQPEDGFWTLKRCIGSAISGELSWLKDDWNLWQALILYAEQSVDRSVHNELHICVERYLDSKPQLRTAQLLKLKTATIANRKEVDSTLMGGKEQQHHQLPISHACELYLEQCSSKPFLYKDFRGVFNNLKNEEQNAVQRFAAEAAMQVLVTEDHFDRDQLLWLNAEINALKLDFHKFQRIHARLQFTAEATQDKLDMCRTILSNSLRLIELSKHYTTTLPKTDTNPGDEAGLIAVGILDLLATTTLNTNYSILAICIAEFILHDSAYHSELRIRLVKAYKQLCLYSSAWEAYKPLKVKESLSEQMCPIMFTDVGSTHPFASKSKNFDPLRALQQPLSFYEESIRHIPEYQFMALKHENYEESIQLDSFLHSLKHSPTRKLLLLEYQRIQLITAASTSECEKQADTLLELSSWHELAGVKMDKQYDELVSGFYVNDVSGLLRSFHEPSASLRKDLNAKETCIESNLLTILPEQQVHTRVKSLFITKMLARVFFKLKQPKIPSLDDLSRDLQLLQEATSQLMHQDFFKELLASWQLLVPLDSSTYKGLYVAYYTLLDLRAFVEKASSAVKELKQDKQLKNEVLQLEKNLKPLKDTVGGIVGFMKRGVETLSDRVVAFPRHELENLVLGNHEKVDARVTADAVHLMGEDYAKDIVECCRQSAVDSARGLKQLRWS